MNLPLKEFLETITYEQLFHKIALPVKYEEYIRSEPSWDTLCYIDVINPLLIEVYYPIDNWYRECKRLKEIDTIIGANHLEQLARRQVREKQERNAAEVTRLKGLMFSAALQDRADLVEQYSKQIKEMNTQ